MEQQLVDTSVSQAASKSIMFEQVLILLDHLIFASEQRHLSPPEIVVLQGAWNDLGYDEMSNNSRFSVNYLQRNVAPSLWHLLSRITGKQHVDKKNLRSFLENLFTNQLISVNQNHLHIKGDKPPKICNFFGRIEELTFLQNAVRQQQFLVLTGIPGIGKSALAAKLLSEITTENYPDFNQLIWKSLARGPSLQELVSEIIEIIEPQILPESLSAKVSLLIKLMSSHRCLIIFDVDDLNFLFRRLGADEREHYGIFFRRLAEERHQSCLMITCRVPSCELEELLETKRCVEQFRLEGLDLSAARELLSSCGLNGEQQYLDDLIHNYCGHPSELESVAKTIQLFFGNLNNFFKNKITLLSKQLKGALDQKFAQQELSDIQYQIMSYLAEHESQNPNSLKITQILRYFGLDTNTNGLVLLEALEGLEKESLLEIKRSPNQEVCFTLRPGVKRFILSRKQPTNHLAANSA